MINLFSRIGKKRSSENTREAHNLKIAVSQAAPATIFDYSGDVLNVSI